MSHKALVPNEAREPGACACGYAEGHIMISPVGEYTTIGWVLLLVGITSTPKLIRHECRQCKTVLRRTVDPVELRETRLV